MKWCKYNSLKLDHLKTIVARTKKLKLKCRKNKNNETDKIDNNDNHDYDNNNTNTVLNVCSYLHGCSM